MKTILLLLITISSFGQKLHHQMLSSQGGAYRVSSGVYLRQTIGQLSVAGNFNGASLVVGQGFQQSKSRKAASAPIISIQTIAYPNPFIDKVNFQFSSPVQGIIKISLFDVLGRLVYTTEKFSINSILTIDNIFLPDGEYFAKLTANNYSYTTNLLKSR